MKTIWPSVEMRLDLSYSISCKRVCWFFVFVCFFVIVVAFRMCLSLRDFFLQAAFDSVCWCRVSLHLDGRENGTICLAPSIQHRLTNYKLLGMEEDLSIDLLVDWDYRSIWANWHHIRKTKPKNWSHTLAWAKSVTPCLCPIRRMPIPVLVMVPTNLSSNCLVCASIDQQVENSWMSQGLQFSLVPAAAGDYSNCPSTILLLVHLDLLLIAPAQPFIWT